jgi:anti-sigma factor RsiW
VDRVTCRQFILDFLADYLDAKIGPEIVAELERHLAICPPCVAYMNTYKRTRELVGRTAPAEMPQEMKAILRKFLLEQLAKGKS